MTPPFRIGVMQLTMEPLAEMLETARALDRGGFDTIWLAEAYPWWRKHGMEARSSTVVSALMARDTERLTIALGDHLALHPPSRPGRDGRARRPGGGRARAASSSGSAPRRSSSTTRSRAGSPKETKPLAHMRDSVAIVRGAFSGERFEYDGKVFSADLPALQPEAHAPRLGRAGLRRRDRAADAAARRRDRRRAADAVDHDARVRPLHAPGTSPRAPRRRAATRTRSTSAARSSPRSTRPTATAAATARARSPACTSRTSSRTSGARPTRCSTWPRSRWRSSARSPRRWSAAAGSPRRSR